MSMFCVGHASKVGDMMRAEQEEWQPQTLMQTQTGLGNG